MRVISGKARRLNLKTPEGDFVRPTTDRIKETLFNIISSDINDCVFVDLFSGSGAIGIEALSRGAKKVYFVENYSESLQCIRTNLEFTKLKENALIYPSDVVIALKQMEKINLEEQTKVVFDIVFMDPPYNKGLEKKVLELLSSSNLIDNQTLIIIECDIKCDINFIEEQGFRIIREKKYKTNRHIFVKRI